VTRTPNRHEIQQYSVQILLEGDNMTDVYTEGNNAKVVATDTCKNTVYCIANNNKFDSIEEFGLLLCKHFLTEYPTIVNKVCIQILQDNWERLVTPDSRGKMTPHHHAFRRIGPAKQFAHITASRKRTGAIEYSIDAGIRNVDLMKTTQSGFVGFHRNRYTSLPDATDRLLGTSMDAEWSYSPQQLARGGAIPFNKVSLACLN
jgi:urate oxidase